MPLEHLVVTPLPHGRSGNTLYLSVHLSPRLREKGVLSDYPDFADWGAFVNAGPALQFQPLFNGAVRPGVNVSIVSPAVNPDVWRAVFGAPPDKVYVEPFKFRDRSDIQLAAINSGAASEQITSLVRELSTRRAANVTKRDIQQVSGGLFRTTLPGASDFFRPVGNGEDPNPPSQEFHDLLGPLCAHPFLMRALGLVFDLEVTIPAAAGAINTIAVRTNWPLKNGLGPRFEAPVRVRVDSDFRAIVDDKTYRVDDWLALAGTKYSIGQLDLINAVHQMAQLDAEMVATTNGSATIEIPALLESGLSVICGDLGDVLKNRLERQRRIEDKLDAWYTNVVGAVPPLLYAEDITLGYRCDVEDVASPGYRSLHDRQAPDGYRFPRRETLKLVPPVDEGWGSIALMTDGATLLKPATTGVRYQQEGGPTIDKVEELDATAWRVDDHIFTWGGWSLSTPRVGASTTGLGVVKKREPNKPDPSSPVQVVVDYAHVKGTLPKLRYGHTYNLRARCVDLSGDGPVLADKAPTDGEAPPTKYGRLAPLVAPLPVRRASRLDPGVGDLADVLVIRSELEQADSDTAPTDRLLFPSRISQGRLERHDLPNGGNDPSSYAFIAERDALSLADQTIVDPETGELVAGSALVDGEVTAGPLRPPVLYLADPVGEKVAFIGLPGGDPEDPAIVGFGAWPDYEAAQLELRAGDGAPHVARNDRRVTVRLPKGTIFEAAVSTAPDRSLVDHMALAQHLGPSDLDRALVGLNHAISPRRPLTLVHAVRLPLDPPSFIGTTAVRTEPGQTDVVLEGRVGMHRRTTEHVVLRSRWLDTVDDPAAPAPFERISKRIVSDIQIPLNGNASSEPLTATRLELGDTQRRVVDVAAESFCRFSRYFTERIDFATGTASLQLHPEGVVPTSVVLSRKDDGTRFKRGTHFSVERDGALSILDPIAIPLGTVCRVEFIPLPVSRLSDAAQVLSFDVPSSAPPLVPDVRAVLPAFARTITETDTNITVVHDGRVLRLHLARPWYSSGVGELLGVAVDPAGTPELAYTRWGRDPITAGTGALDGPTIADFPAAVERAEDVDGRFDVAAHAAVFDGERGFWTSDVRIDANFGYRPFAQLHVCRYQPHSLEGQHASGTIVLAPVRLGALRLVEVTSTALGQIHVRLSGPDNENVVSVIVQEADPTIADVDLRWSDVSTTVLVRSGTTSAAAHEGHVAVGTAALRRIVVEDAEPLTVDDAGVATPATVVVYREVVELPEKW